MAEGSEGRWKRERKARKRAEELLEQKSRELFEASEELRRLNVSLEARVAERTAELTELNESLLRESRQKTEAQQELRLARFATDHGGDGIFWLRPDASLFYVNETACRWLGYSADELRNMSVFDVDVVLPREAWEDHWRDLRERKSFTLESRHRRKDGSEFPVEVTVNHLEFEGQEFNCAVVRDVSERLARDAETRMLSLVAARTTNAVVLTDAVGRVEWVNEGFSRLTGYALEDIKGRTPGSFLQGDETDPGVVDFMRSRIAEGKSFQAEVVNYARNGRKYWVAIEAQPIFGADGELRSYMAIESDVTPQKLARRELEISAKRLSEALGQAQSASEAKSTFLASMSHEIRTPMTAIVGYADLLTRSSPERAEREDWVAQLRRNAHYLMALLNDVLDLSKIEAGEIELQNQETDLPELMDEIFALMAPRAVEKLLAISLNCNGPVPLRVHTDALRVRQILVNLLSNAIKFTDRGGIRVDVQAEQVERGEVLFRIDVADTGCGIAPERIASLFEPFYQAHGGRQVAERGTGLGLSISRRFARMLGGDITVESTPDKGSTFSATLRVKPVAACEWSDRLALRDRPAESAEGDGRRHDGLNVHIVDDNPQNIRILQFLLEEMGCKVSTSSDGHEGSQAALEMQRAGEPPDVILMDMQMPVMDGYQATAELRRQGYLRPIVALTAFAMAGDREKCLAAGCDDYLTKPILPDMLNKVLSAHDPRSGHEKRIAASGESAQPLRSMRADDPAFAPLLEEYVASLPEVVEAIATAIRSRDVEQLRVHAHRLRGTSASYGYPEVTERAAECEDAIRTGAAWADVASRADKLLQLLDRMTLA